MIHFRPARRRVRFLLTRRRPRNSALCPLTGERRAKALEFLRKHAAPRPICVGERFDFYPRKLGKVTGVWLGGEEWEVGDWR
jgi:hypothetical protein